MGKTIQWNRWYAIITYLILLIINYDDRAKPRI